MNPKKRALGRGLSSLLENADNNFINKTAISGSIISIPINLIEANPFQPRDNFELQALESLADSIEKIGIIQPITICQSENQTFRLIAGERRLRAAKMAGLTEIPAFIRTADSDLELLQMALIENIQREDLNPIEVSLSFKRLVDEFNLTQEELSNKVGKKRTTVTNYLRLLKLPAEIQAGIRDGLLSMGHARALISINNETKQLKIFKRIVENGLSVREVEKITKDIIDNAGKEKTKKDNNIVYSSLKKELSSKLGLKIDLKKDIKGFVNVVIKCSSDSELEKIVGLLKK